MRVLFWFSFLTVGYAYFGYALLLAFYARIFRKPVAHGSATPSVSIITAAHNEENRLPAKLANLSALQYPSERLEMVIASDGSYDNTVQILSAYAVHDPRVKWVVLDRAMGKASALNEAVRHARGEILVFLDVRQSVDLNAIEELVSCFEDPRIGAVSGELLLTATDGASSDSALGIYWKIEKAIRKLESQSGSVVGATGAIYAVRRECYVDIPEGTILDDVFVPMQVVRMGRRVVFHPAAIARDLIFVEPGKEFARKVRTLTGNYQLVKLAPWLLSPANPILFRFISHKMLRLAVPVFLITMLIACGFAGGVFYKTMLMLQLVFYGLGMLGSLNRSTQRFKPVAIANTFMMLNLASGLAFYSFVARRRKIWV